MKSLTASKTIAVIFKLTFYHLENHPNVLKMYFEEGKTSISSEIFTGLGTFNQELEAPNGENSRKYI